MTAKGTIYFRDNAWYRQENVIKMGISSFAKNRNDTYITSEIERGRYVCVIEIPLNKMKLLDNHLKSEFKQYNDYRGGGTEFYRRCVVDLIKPLLQKLNVEYRVLTEDEILLMERRERLSNIPNVENVKKVFNHLKLQKIIQQFKTKRQKKSVNRQILLQNIATEIAEINQIQTSIQTSCFIPKEQQQHIIDNIEKYYRINTAGKIDWACGLGKALLSVFIVKQLRFKTIVIGVPSNQLQKQMKTEISHLFPNPNNILFVGGEDDDETESTTNKEQIRAFLKQRENYSEPRFIITTYHSCHLLVQPNLLFDFKIGDEAHHLVGVEKEEERGFRQFHKIQSIKSLFMTATEKTIEPRMNNTADVYSMDDEKVFGKCIDTKTVFWAIENKKITDYSILVIKNSEEDIDDIISKLRRNNNNDVNNTSTVYNKELVLSCFMSLKSFEKYQGLQHLFLYTNTTEDAEKAKQIINDILSLNIVSITAEQLYNNALHSKSNVNIDDELDKFTRAEYGIISCVHLFGEGTNIPELTGVCIAGNMHSETRIVQYLLRPNRLNKNKPDKHSHIIIPCIDTDDWETECKSYDRVKTIVAKMRIVDENIEQKIFVSVCEKKQKQTPAVEKEKAENREELVDYELEENSRELNRLKLRLRHSKSLNSKFTEEQDEYNLVRSVNIELKIQSKEEYNEKKNSHSQYIAFPEEYFKSKGVWKDWYDFMGVKTSIFIQSKQDWINYCKELQINSLEQYYAYCETVDVLPKEPADFYKDFSNIINELNLCVGRRR